MNSNKLRDEILKAYYKGKDKQGFSEYELAEAEKAIRQAVGEELLELVGEDDYSERNGLVGLTHRDETRNELKAELRAKIKQWSQS